MNSFKTFFRSYHPIVLTLVFGHGLSRIGSSMSMPFLALYLAHNTSMSHAMIGVVAGAGALAGTFGGFIGGALSDRVGRRVIMLTALFLWACCFIGFAVAKLPLMFLLLNMLNGLCRSWFEPVSQALMADLTPPDKRMKVFSMRYLAANIGVSAGPLLGAWLGMGEGAVPFVVTGFIYLLYGIVLYVLLLSFGIKQIEGPPKEKITLSSAWQVVRRDTCLKMFLLGAIFVGVGYCQMTVTLSQVVEANFEGGVRLFAALISVNAVTVILLQIPISRWAEKRSPLLAIHVGNVLFAAGLLGFGFSKDWFGLAVAMVVFTLGEILNYPAGSVLLDRLAPEGMRGTYFGAQTFGNLGQFIGPWVGGYLLGAYNGTVMFTVMALVVLGASVFYGAGTREFAARSSGTSMQA
ncbi:MFS transporter [Cohnella sp. CFH 77786]|uniref:MDR family MFS transporter n=1 Tax=Cohnella sp. CFH 77786 TaxID=2662265 RepID=UPI001C61104B|nr:MFS transporter [Cohnella sp. CFH 77786]MBW5445500.1 MFS transporter [Cohnella sp. CFH 77786]